MNDEKRLRTLIKKYTGRDLWSLGNILNYAAAKGIVTFRSVRRDKNVPERVKSSLSVDDASAFYAYRIMNLKKVFHYIPERLNRILLHFTAKPVTYYEHIDEFINEYMEMLDMEFPVKS